MKNSSPEILGWLKTFEQCVQDENYLAARALFHPDCYCFGSKAKRTFSLEDLIENQWKKIWPNIQDFCFDFELLQYRVSESEDLATVVCPWHSVGFHADGRSYPRDGRVTLIFLKDPTHRRWLAYHTHYSLNPGTPTKTIIPKRRIIIKDLR